MEQTATVCQSCGMPLIDDGDRGTEADGTPSPVYCQYCYTNGQFTEPDLTLDGMLDRAATVLSELYGMAPEKAQDFVALQIPHLKRWTEAVVPVCQSCGMPMNEAGDFGTEEDGSGSEIYCSHCYQQGAFTEPDMTQDEMIRRCAPVLAKECQIPTEQAAVMVRQYLSGLKRWRRSS
jgi:hypothetical protein